MPFEDGISDESDYYIVIYTFRILKRGKRGTTTLVQIPTVQNTAKTFYPNKYRKRLMKRRFAHCNLTSVLPNPVSDISHEKTGRRRRTINSPQPTLENKRVIREMIIPPVYRRRGFYGNYERVK